NGGHRPASRWRILLGHKLPLPARIYRIHHALSVKTGARYFGRIEGAIAHIPDVLADPEYRFFESQRLGGFRTSLGILLLREGTPIGGPGLARPPVGRFRRQQKRRW